MRVCRALLLGAATIAGGAVGAARAEIRIAVIGDSNAAGYGLSAGQAYPARLERALRAKGLDARVRNAGLNGDTTAHLASRLAAAAPDGTRIAVIWIGTNDLRQGIAPAVVRRHIDTIAAQLRARGIEAVRIERSEVAPLFADRRLVLRNRHLNGAGYERVVDLTLPRIEKTVRKLVEAGDAGK
jgi:lysophospholipase L1-like esterase